LASLATRWLGSRRGVIGGIMTCHDALSRCGQAIPPLDRLAAVRGTLSATSGAKDQSPESESGRPDR